MANYSFKSDVPVRSSTWNCTKLYVAMDTCSLIYIAELYLRWPVFNGAASQSETTISCGCWIKLLSMNNCEEQFGIHGIFCAIKKLQSARELEPLRSFRVQDQSVNQNWATIKLNFWPTEPDTRQIRDQSVGFVVGSFSISAILLKMCILPNGVQLTEQGWFGEIASVDLQG